MLSRRIGFGSSISTPSTPRPSGSRPILRSRLFVDAFVDELDQLVVVAAHAERPVLGVHQLDRGVHDGAQRVVEFQAGGDHQHGLDEAVEAVSALDDLLDAVLDLAQQLAQPQLGQGGTQRASRAGWNGRARHHRGIVDAGLAEKFRSITRRGGVSGSSLVAKTAACVRRSMPSLASSRDT